MPSVSRRTPGLQQRQVVANHVNRPLIQDLRQQCLDKDLSDHGRQNSTLIMRL